MEWYKRKPIMYGLGHFVFDFVLGMTQAQLDRLLRELSPEGFWDAACTVVPRERWPYLLMHPDTRMALVA